MKTLNLTDNERLELADLQFALDTSIYDIAHQASDSLWLSGTDPGYIIDGFVIANPSGKLLTVTRGARRA